MHTCPVYAAETFGTAYRSENVSQFLSFYLWDSGGDATGEIETERRAV